MNEELIEKIRKAGIDGITDNNCANLTTESAREIINLCQQGFLTRSIKAIENAEYFSFSKAEIIEIIKAGLENE